MKLNPAIYFLFLIILSVFVYFLANKSLEETTENKVQSLNINFNNQTLENLSLNKKDENSEAWENYMKLKSSECAPLKITNFKPDSIEKEYINFLNELNCHEPQSISLAKEELKRLFTNPAKNDTLFYIFNEFYSNVTDSLNSLMNYDTTNYLTYESKNFPSNKIPREVISFRNLLHKNGLLIEFPEGIATIVQNKDLLEDLYKNLSPKMVEFLKQVNKETKEGFQEDAFIYISDTTFLERILWWENFEKNCGLFIYKNYAKEIKIEYLNYAIVGADNTAPFYENGNLESYFVNLYKLALQNQSNSECIQILSKHYSIIKKHNNKDSKERKNYLKELKNKGLITFFY